MGVSWQDRDKFAHVIMIVPDGRIVCQRPIHPSSVKMWQATAYRKIPRLYSNTPEAAVSSAARELLSLFTVNVSRSAFTHIASHYIEQMAKRLELVTCKMRSRDQLLVSRHVEVSFLTLEELIKEIEKDRGAFAPHTLHAINVLDTMVWG